jgi:DNA-binding NtrC family response regulator
MSPIQHRILFVEDSADVLQSLKLFCSIKLPTVHAEFETCPRAALLKLASCTFSLVVSDEDLGGTMPGHMLLKHLKQLAPNTQRMMLTAFSNLDEMKSLARLHGITHLLGKPFKQEALLSIIQQSLQTYELKTTSSN